MTTTAHGGLVTARESHRRSYTPPSPQAGDCLPTVAVSRGLLLSAAVHDEGPSEVAGILNHLDRQDLVELAVTLAAMVPVDYTPTELLAWNDSQFALPSTAQPADGQPPLFPAVLVTRQLRPHGTHAAFVRHRKNHQEPCDTCWHGEREYQRTRKRRTRATAIVDEASA